MPRKNAKLERINALIEQLNDARHRRGLPPVKREWTGAAHWLSYPCKENASGYRQINMSLCVSDDQFIGFLEGLLSAMALPEPRIVVTASGGVVTGVLASFDATVDVLDFDEEEDREELDRKHKEAMASLKVCL